MARNSGSKTHASSGKKSSSSKRDGRDNSSSTSGPSQSSGYQLGQYVQDPQRHEQIALGISTHQQLQQWDANWQAASGQGSR